MEANGSAMASHGGPERIFVKWPTPEDELSGSARLLEAFHHRRIDQANDLAIVVPNMAWAVQAQRACDACGLKASIRAGRVHLSDAAKSRLALLDIIAHPDDAGLRSQWQRSGHSDGELAELLSHYGKAQASALVRLVDLRACPELAHGLLHVCGDETPQQLYDVLMGQLENPTAPEGLQVAAIVAYRHMVGTYSQAIFVGCVDGLVSGPLGDGAWERGERQACEQAFAAVADHVSKRLYYSGFSQVDAGFAQRAGIRFARTKAIGGNRVALTRPTPLFSLFGADRPSTLGSQALLRMYGLN